MLETKWQIDEDEGKGWTYSKSRSLFAQMKTNLLEEELIKLIKTDNTVDNRKVYEQTLRLGYLPKHAVEVLYSLQEDGRLEVVSDTGERARKGAFYINYENYKNKFSKVHFKIN